MRKEKSSTLDSEAILWKLREKLSSGQLPRIDANRIWGGPGAGEPCSVCDQVVPPDSTEIEADVRVEDNAITLRCHTYCFSLWEIERQS